MAKSTDTTPQATLKALEEEHAGIAAAIIAAKNGYRHEEAAALLSREHLLPHLIIEAKGPALRADLADIEAALARAEAAHAAADERARAHEEGLSRARQSLAAADALWQEAAHDRDLAGGAVVTARWRRDRLAAELAALPA